MDDILLKNSLGKVNWKPHFLFFIVPAGLQIIISMVLFIITATHCNRVKREIHRMQSSGSSESASKKEKFMASKTMYVIFFAYQICGIFFAEGNGQEIR